MRVARNQTSRMATGAQMKGLSAVHSMTAHMRSFNRSPFGFPWGGPDPTPASRSALEVAHG